MSVRKDYHTIVQAGTHLVEVCQRELFSDLTTVQTHCLLEFVAVDLFDLIWPMQTCVVQHLYDIVDLCAVISVKFVEHYCFTSQFSCTEKNRWCKSPVFQAIHQVMYMFHLSLWFFCSVMMLGSGYIIYIYRGNISVVKEYMSCYVLQNLLSGHEHLPTVGLIN